MKLILAKLFNTPVLVSPVKAMQLYKIVSQKIKDGNPVTLDFLGVQGITSSFIYIVFSNLLKEYEKNLDELKKFITISNPTQVLIKEIEYLKDNYRVIENKMDRLSISYVN